MLSPLLSIAIPTYNRAPQLDRCLAVIAAQVGPLAQYVSVIISNNASTDNTREIVEKHRPALPALHYYQNETNLGADLNIARCFELATTKYVWIFSDDDVLLPGQLAPIIEVVKQHELGVVFLTPTWFNKEVEDVLIIDEPFACRLFADPLAYLREVHYLTTFITSNIINKSLVANLPGLYRFKNSHLIQLGWTLPAIFSGSLNAQVSSPVVLGWAATKSVDYRFFEVFSQHITRILTELVASAQIPAAASDIIIRKLLTVFFPQYLPPNKPFFNGERPFGTLYRTFKGYREFWLVLVPLFVKRLYIGPVGRASRQVRRLVLELFSKIARSSASYQAQRSGRQLRGLGANSSLPAGHTLTNPQCISIGRRFAAQPHLCIEAWPEYAGEAPGPQVVIGDDVTVGRDCHISCVRQVSIGDHVLLGNRVSITDNAPDEEPAARALPPARRPLRARGPIIIEARVLLEDGVSIRSGVRIGEGAVVRAGAVVCDDVAAYAVVAGNPARKV